MRSCAGDGGEPLFAGLNQGTGLFCFPEQHDERRSPGREPQHVEGERPQHQIGAKNVIVTMPGGDQLEAKIVGKDYSTGIGLLKIDRKKLASVEVVSSEKCVVGQEAFTVSSMGGEKRCADDNCHR